MNKKKRMRYCYKVASYNRDSCTISPNSMYSLKYNKGATVKAVDGSLGIFVFKRRMDAVSFRADFRSDLILRVIPNGRGKSPNIISSMRSSSELDNFYHKPNRYYLITIKIPEGTICYPSVYVVD